MFNFSNYSFNPYSIPGMVSAALLLFIGIYVLLQNRKHMPNISFFITTLSATIWLSGISIIYLTKNIELAIFYYKYYTFLGVAFITPSVFMNTVSILDLFKKKKKFIWMNYIIAFIFYIFAFKTDWLVIGVKKYFWGNYIQYGFLGYPFLFFFFILMIMSFYHYATQLRKIEEGTKKEQIRLLFIALLIAYIGAIDYVACFGIELYPFGYIPILIFISIQGYAIVTYQKVNVGEILNSMQDGIIAINADGKVAIINNSAERIIGAKSSDILGRKLAEIFSFSTHKLEYPERFMKLINRINSAPGEIINEEISYSNPIRYINITTMPVRDRFGAISGNILRLSDITERKHAENTIRESEKKYRELVQNTNSIILRIDNNGRITFFNQFAHKFFGYTEDEILGKNLVGTIVPETDTSHRDLRVMIKDIIKNPERYAVNENENIRRNGEQVWILWINKGVFDKDGHISEILCIGNDITERKKAEESLRKSQQEFASLFNSSPEALAYEDLDGTILNINPRFTELFGYTLKEIKGRNIDDGMIHPPYKLEEGKGLTKRSLKCYFNYETIRKRKDGRLFPVSISGSRVMLDGKLQGTIGMYRDITERKQNEKLQQVLYNISKAANSPISLGQIYKTIHQELSTILDTANFYIALVDEKEDKIFFPYNIDNTKPIHLPRTINHDSLVAEVIRTGKPIFVNQEMIKKGKTLMEFKEWFGMLRKVWLGTPLKIEDKVIGAMVVQSYTNPNLYSEKDIKIMEFVSSQVTTAIERKQTEESIKHLSFHDALTGLYNRAYFEEELKRTNNPRYYPLSIISLDVNGLKVINDTFGHDQGDKLLQHLASLLTSISRKGDIIARVGGDEFAILLPSTNTEQGYDFCQRTRKVCLEDDIKPAYLKVSLALGCLTQEGEYKDIKILLKEVDQKMYQDKLFSAKSREKHLLNSFQLVLAERDPHTEDHSQRLQELALVLGKRVGFSEYQLNNLKLLALLHDIGKIGIPDNILFKTDTLTPSEWKKMREHSRIGYRMAKNIPNFSPIAQEILYHHEHWDGNGYPDGLKGEKIPLLSRIISIVDAYDVMQSRRPYKGKITKAKALKEIKRYAGTQFDPQLVKIFLKIVKT